MTAYVSTAEIETTALSAPTKALRNAAYSTQVRNAKRLTLNKGDNEMRKYQLTENRFADEIGTCRKPRRLVGLFLCHGSPLAAV